MSDKWKGWKDERRARPLSASELERDDEDAPPDESPRAEHGAVIWDEAALATLRDSYRDDA